jgi:sodium/potassium-transporting ATPase subunit alpha
MQKNPQLTADILRNSRHEGEGRALIVEGQEVLGLTDGDWNLVCEYEEIVFARTTPEQKLRIVNE